MYYYARRIKGKKWEAVAGTSRGECLAEASEIFASIGLNHWHRNGEQVCWQSSLESQKNYAGKAHFFINLDIPVSSEHLKEFKRELDINN